MLVAGETIQYNIRVSSLIGIIFILTIFSKSLTYEVGGLGGIDLYAYPVLFLFFLFHPIKLKTFLYILIVFSILFIINLIIKLYFSYSILPLLKQIIPAFIIYTAAISFLKKKDIRRVFQLYSKIALIFAGFGLIQVMLSFIGVDINNDPRFHASIKGINFMRLSSLLPEPSHFSVVVLPAFIYYFIRKGVKAYQTLLLLFALLFTFSLAAYASIFITLIIYYFKRFNLISLGGIIILSILTYTLYRTIDPIKYKIDETIKYSDINNFTNQTNTTTFSLISNLNVALYSLKKDFLFGVGLGGHEEVYSEYFDQKNYSKYSELFERHGGINAASAHSLLIRIVSELGLFTLFIIAFFLINYKAKKDQSQYYAVSLACLAYFIARCFKLGGYFDYGIYFFIVAYYRSYVQQKAEQ
jgi:hypothetical protein